MSDIGLYQTQKQTQIMGPQMQQSLHILQAPTLELRQLIQQEISVNPVLEMEQPEISLNETLPHRWMKSGATTGRRRA
jgi:RNA polymerase sigma-54 factor